jgi:hypothetical protein
LTEIVRFFPDNLKKIITADVLL